MFAFVVLGLVSSVLVKRSAGKNACEMAYFVSSGTSESLTQRSKKSLIRNCSADLINVAFARSQLQQLLEFESSYF